MSKYKNPAYEAEMDDEKSYSEEMAAQAQQAPEDAEPAATVEEGQFKKRYSDLRRHMQHKEQEFQKQQG